jgi:hypothetical protein
MNNTFLRIVATIIGAVIGYAVVSGLFQAGCGHISTRRYLTLEAEATNKKLPMMVDADTRIDKVEVGDGTNNIMIYDYTLPRLTKNQIDASVLQKNLRPQLIANYRTNNLMQRMRDQGVELDYHYVDKNGDFIFEQSVSPKDF